MMNHMKNLLIHKKARWMMLLASFLLLPYSCADEDNPEPIVEQKTDEVLFGVGGLDDWSKLENGQTRSVVKRSKTVLLDCLDGEQIYMYMLEEDNLPEGDSLSFQMKSRASVAIPDTDTDDLGVYAFVMKNENDEKPVYPGTETAGFMADTKLDVSEGYSYSPVKYWPGANYWIRFFAYRPFRTNIIGHNTDPKKFNISVSVGDSFLPTITYEVPTDVNEQTDLQAASTDVLKGDVHTLVQLNFRHIMTSVEVKVGNISNGTITSFGFEGLKSKGNHVVGTDLWTNLTGNAEYVQSPNHDVIGNNKIVGQTFYLMPQNIFDNEDAKITLNLAITRTFNGVEKTRNYPLERNLKDFFTEESKSWLPGKKYTYVLTTPEEVEVEVYDEVEGKVKKNLTITNTGLAPAYIRAAIIGNWIVPDDNDSYYVFADWKDTDGIFDWGSNSRSVSEPTHWRLGSDGYYYYMTLVPAGAQVPVPLFNTYTLTATAPVANAELNLVIAVQAVHPDYVKSIWSEDITNDLKTN